MATELDTRSGGAVTTHSSTPSSVMAALNSVVVHNGKTYRDPIPEAERSWILRRLTELNRKLAGDTDESRKRKALALLFSAFPASQISDEMVRAKVAAYLMALEELPSWVVETAAKRWVCGEAEPDAKFAPSPPQLKGTCKAILDVTNAERLSWQRFIDAPEKSEIPQRPKPAWDSGAKVIPIHKLSLPAMSDASRRPAKQMSEAERLLIEAMANGENVTPEMIAAAEQQAK